MRYARISLLLILFTLTSLAGCASGPQAVPMAVACPPAPVLPQALMDRPVANQYLLQTTEPSKLEQPTTPNH